MVHRTLLNDISPGSGQSLIHNQGGNGVRNPNAMEDLLNSILSIRDKDDE